MVLVCDAGVKQRCIVSKIPILKCFMAVFFFEYFAEHKNSKKCSRINYLHSKMRAVYRHRHTGIQIAQQYGCSIQCCIQVYRRYTDTHRNYIFYQIAFARRERSDFCDLRIPFNDERQAGNL